MGYPVGVKTRPIRLGGAVSVEAGLSLSVRTVTSASRALIHVASGERLEKEAYSSTSPLKGELVWWEIAATDQPGFLDADTHEMIVLGADEHTHLYTTTLTVFAGTEQVAEYTVGPYPVPYGDGSVLDVDTMLIPNDTAEGQLVAIPSAWQQIVDAAETVASGRGAANGIAPLGGDTRLPDTFLPERLSEAAFGSRFPAIRKWDPATESYPPRIDGFVNFFLGPVPPGVVADEEDQWDNPDLTTLLEVQSTISDPGSDLAHAVAVAASAKTSFFLGAAQLVKDPTSSVTVFSVDATTRVPAWQLPTGTVTRLFAGFIVPDGWEKVKVTPYWFVKDAGAGNVAWVASFNALRHDAPIGAGVATTSVFPVAAVGTLVAVSEPAAQQHTVTPGDFAQFFVGRNAASGSDTFASPVYLVGVKVDRV